MRELEDVEKIRKQKNFYATEMQELTDISEIISYDALRYERILEAEEEINEL